MTKSAQNKINVQSLSLVTLSTGVAFPKNVGSTCKSLRASIGTSGKLFWKILVLNVKVWSQTLFFSIRVQIACK